MSGPPIAVVLFVSLPLLVVWLFVLVDVVRQPAMPGWRKAAWILACTVFVPIQVVYLLIRPQRGRAAAARERSDPRSRLVEAALAHEDGRMDDASWAAVARRLRGAD